MKRTILKDVGIGLCFLLSTGTVCAQNYPRKVKNAQGIEVTYQSNYKGKARPGHLLMTVSGDRVSLTNVWPEQNDRPNSPPGRQDTCNRQLHRLHYPAGIPQG